MWFGILLICIIIIAVVHDITVGNSPKILVDKNAFKLEDLSFNHEEAQKIFETLKEKYFEGTPFTEEEDNKLEKDIENLNIDEYSKDILEGFFCSLAMRRLIVGLPTEKIQLKKNELNYFQSSNAVVSRVDSILREINYSGFRFNQGAFKTGNMLVKSRDITGEKYIGGGRFFVTNQRILFIDSNTSSTIQVSLDSVVSYATYESDGVIFVLSNKKPLIVHFPVDGYFKDGRAEGFGVLFNDDKINLLYSLDTVFEERKKELNVNP